MMQFNIYNHSENLLPGDGMVLYFGKVLPTNATDTYFNILLTEIEWQNDQALIFGKRITTKRKVAWYADKSFEYTYSCVTKQALLWTPALLELKTLSEKTTGETYNSCLLNLYHDGSEGMAWHSDGEADLKKNGSIASLSFGAERRFGFKHKKTGEKIYCHLEHGSLLEMKGQTQSRWLHRLPTTTKICTPRINLTFRTIVT